MSYSVSLQGVGRNQTLLDDIDQAISIILFTRPGERIYNPAYGCSLLDILDAPHYFLQQALVSIVEALGRFEKRIRVIKVDVGLLDVDAGGKQLAQGIVQVRLVWQVRTTGLTQSRQYMSDGTIITPPDAA